MIHKRSIVRTLHSWRRAVVENCTFPKALHQGNFGIMKKKLYPPTWPARRLNKKEREVVGMILSMWVGIENQLTLISAEARERYVLGALSFPGFPKESTEALYAEHLIQDRHLYEQFEGRVSNGAPDSLVRMVALRKAYDGVIRGDHAHLFRAQEFEELLDSLPK